MRRLSLFFICLFVPFTLVVTLHHALGKEPSQTVVNDFGDGIVVLTVDRTSGLESKRSSSTLTEARLVEMGGRYFIRGKLYVSPQIPEGEWSKGVDAAYAWDDVTSFFVFNEEQIEHYIKKQQEKADE